ncbi:MAG TPA: 2-hydroxyacyl-CoA dehydratase family protein, partial [Steroidobacteraceae bacterium]|nr:2-hydroxyacyl-CoA dehydratase family protein [Steroidobacteraceae bacterium]
MTAIEPPNAGRIVGYVGSDVPVELILAAGARPMRLSGRAGHATPRADEFVERAFMPDVRSIAEQWLDGSLAFVDTIVLPRSDDSAQRLYYYICELQRRGLCDGPRPLIYDVASIGRLTSRAHTVAATARLAQELGSDPAKLAAAAEVVARRGAFLADVSAVRLEPNPPQGSAIHALARASAGDWSSDFESSARETLRTLPRVTPAARVLLAGSTPPDERLHLALESRGVTVVRELNDAQFLEMPGVIGPSCTFEDIAARHHLRRNTAQLLMQSPEALVNEARAVR